MASRVGKPLYVDKPTQSFARVSYARICIEVNAEAELPDSFSIFCEGEKCEVLWSIK